MFWAAHFYRSAFLCYPWRYSSFYFIAFRASSCLWHQTCCSSLFLRIYNVNISDLFENAAIIQFVISNNETHFKKILYVVVVIVGPMNYMARVGRTLFWRCLLWWSIQLSPPNSKKTPLLLIIPSSYHFFIYFPPTFNGCWGCSLVLFSRCVIAVVASLWVR